MKKSNGNISLGDHFFTLKGQTLIQERVGKPLSDKEINRLKKHCNDYNILVIENLTVETFLNESVKILKSYYSDFKNGIDPIWDKFQQDSPSMKLRREFGIA